MQTSKEPRLSGWGFCKPRWNLSPLRYELPFLPALPSGEEWQTFVNVFTVRGLFLCISLPIVRRRVDRRLIGEFKVTAQFSGSVSYGLIEGPKCHLLEKCRGEEMDIDPSHSLSKEFMGFNEAPRSKLRGILRNSPKPLPSFAKATEGSPRLHPRSKLWGIRRRRINIRSSSYSIVAVVGNVVRDSKTLDRCFKFPQANSPITSG